MVENNPEVIYNIIIRKIKIMIPINLIPAKSCLKKLNLKVQISDLLRSYLQKIINYNYLASCLCIRDCKSLFKCALEMLKF